ncbi:MAG: glycosyltransferase family 39 protein, partial [Blastococcus sp.]|nr:glycosyltransferase family 39 protein [Blastococcus sp.]
MRRRPGLTPTRSAEAAALGLIVLAVGIAAGRDLAAHSAEFDEGVYLGSARALADGAALGTDVFASQPPLFFIGLRALASGGAGDPAAMRGAFLLLALGGVLAAALAVRPIAGPVGGCLAALLVGLSPAVVDRAAVVSADVPALALGLMALAAATAAPRHGPRATAVAAAAAGALLAAAVLVKLLAVPFLVAIVAGALRRRAGRREWLAGGM